MFFSMKRSLVVFVALGLAAGALNCGGTDSSESNSGQDEAKDQEENQSADSNEPLEFCDVFGSIARSGSGVGLQRNPSNEQEWDERIRVAEQILQTIPSEYVSHAKTYLELVKARKDLLEPYGYPQVSEIPVKEKEAFIAEHSASQSVANELIAFSRDYCGINRVGPNQQ